jgi:N,N'-diacetylchitobiose transport system substrate-binding protein
MKLRLVAAAALAAPLVLAVASASGSPAPQVTPDRATATTTLTIWLQPEARQLWPGARDAATAAFKRQHPNVEVRIEEQTWTEHLTKFDASLAARTAPDVIELGNTETTKYMAAGALSPINRAEYPNSRTWLQGLTQSCTYRGRLYCVPYYAGARAVLYRKDMFRAAGVRRIPQSLAEFNAAGRRLMRRYGSDPNFSAFYFPGRYWYGAMAFVYDRGGAIARFQNGRWVGRLDSPQAIAGLTAFKRTVLALSRANKTGDEAHPFLGTVFGRGRVATVLANGWEWGLALDPEDGNPRLARQIGAFPMPSYIRGRQMPTFLGGSDLAIPVTSSNKALAADWIAAFTSTQSMRTIATVGRQIPNTTTLANLLARDPRVAPFANAAKRSWFVPTSPRWANVETAGVLQSLGTNILRGRMTVRQAAQRASRQVTQILNADS